MSKIIKYFEYRRFIKSIHTKEFNGIFRSSFSFCKTIGTGIFYESTGFSEKESTNNLISYLIKSGIKIV